MKSRVTNLNAIVGQNGAGKSSFLDIIRETFYTQLYSNYNSDCVILFENENADIPILIRNDFDKVEYVVPGSKKPIELNVGVGSPKNSTF